MAWLSRVNFTASDVLSYTDVNNLGNDIRAWGGNVNAGGYTLSNVVLELLNISGGSSSSSVLTLLSTTGTGTTDSIVFKTGSQVQRMKITSSGVIVIGSADDLSISRNAAGVLQIGDGGSNSNGTVRATSFTNGTNTVPFGGNNLTTAGAIPYVSSAGVLNQDATALFWDAANNRLGIGTNAPSFPLVVSDGSSTVEANASGGAAFLQSGNSPLIIGSRNTGFELRFRTEGTEGMRLTATTRNLLIGTTTDSNFKLDVATSGSAGTARFYGGSGVSNSTKVVVRAGGGQSGNLTEWRSSDNVNGLAAVGDGGYITGSGFANSFDSTAAKFAIGYSSSNDFRIASTAFFVFQSGTSVSAGTADLSLSRASAGVLQVGDGAANANGQVSATRVLHAGVLVAALPAAAAGNAGSIQYVTDANATTIGSTVAGGGANKVMVWSDGAAWKIFAS